MNKDIPVIIEDRVLPVDSYSVKRNKSSYGYANVMLISGLLTTVLMWVLIVVLNK